MKPSRQRILSAKASTEPKDFYFASVHHLAGLSNAAPANASLFKEPVVMALQQVRFHLPHRVQRHAYCDECARAAEEIRYFCGTPHIFISMLGNTAMTTRNNAPANVRRVIT